MSFTGSNEKKVGAAKERDKDSGHLNHVNIIEQKRMQTWDCGQGAHPFTILAEKPPRLAVQPCIWYRKPRLWAIF